MNRKVVEELLLKPANNIYPYHEENPKNISVRERGSRLISFLLIVVASLLVLILGANLIVVKNPISAQQHSTTTAITMQENYKVQELIEKFRHQCDLYNKIGTKKLATLFFKYT